MLKRFARDLRYCQTDAEQKLWSFIRNNRLHGHKFRRQHPIDNYIADFVCIKRKLIIELDGGVHITKSEKKFFVRTQYLQNIGFEVLRYKNEEILTHMSEVLADIVKRLKEPPHSNLSPKGGERKMNE